MAQRTGLTVEDTRRALRMSRQPLSLDQPVGHQEESYLGDLVYDHRQEDPLAGMNQDMLKSRIADVLQTFGLSRAGDHSPALRPDRRLRLHASGDRPHLFRDAGACAADRGRGAAEVAVSWPVAKALRLFQARAGVGAVPAVGRRSSARPRGRVRRQQRRPPFATSPRRREQGGETTETVALSRDASLAHSNERAARLSIPKEPCLGMELAIVTDVKTIQVHPDGGATAVVYWEVGGVPFPEVGWNDFVLVLFEWWSDAVLRIMRDETTIERLRFMDGPFSLLVEKCGVDLKILLVDGRYGEHAGREIHVAKEELCRAILDSAGGLCRHCRSVGINAPIDAVQDSCEGDQTLGRTIALG